jgi:hypothetical protein
LIDSSHPQQADFQAKTIATMAMLGYVDKARLFR